MAQPSPSGPLAIVGAEYCGPSYSSVELSVFTRSMSAPFASLAVTNINGNLMFKIKEKFFTGVYDHKTLVDSLGNLVFTLRPKKMSAHRKCLVFRGQSKDDNDLILTAKTHSTVWKNPTVDVFLASNTAQQVCDFQVKGTWNNRACTVYAGDAKSNDIVAHMQYKCLDMTSKLGKFSHVLTIYPNVDYAFIVALIAVLNNINYS